MDAALLDTGKTERKPVLFFVGSPFTVVIRAEESELKNTCETVLSGPEGGVVCFRSKDRRLLLRGVRPVADMEKHATPAFAPELATQAWDKFVDIVTLVENSPMVLTGWPTAVVFVGVCGRDREH
jgi:hypothetical protein